MAIASPREVSSNTDRKEYAVAMTGSVVKAIEADGDRVCLILSAFGGGISFGWDKSKLTSNQGHGLSNVNVNPFILTMQGSAGLVNLELYAIGGPGAILYVTEVVYKRR